MAPSLILLGTRRWLTAGLVCSLLMFFIVFRDTIANSSTVAYYTRPRDELIIRQGQFWQTFQRELENAKPSDDPLVHPEDPPSTSSWDPGVSRPRPDLLRMTIKQKEAMTKAHSSFVEHIQAKQYALPFVPGTRGIVTTADGAYLPVALVSIRMIREAESKLPIEVFLGSWKEWDSEFCNTILPSLNARCVVLQDILDYEEASQKTTLERYQYKIMSILFSSFEDVLFLDSDCFPIRNPDQLFESEPFRSTGLVVWPDFWFPSESPLYFDIAGFQAPNVSARAARESGEILYSKSKQEVSLLLTTYYNFYGPNFYYPLLSQGAQGEGDKETFLWSAVALNSSYYAVRTPVRAMGYTTKSKQWRGSAMAQFDPMEDFRLGIEESKNDATTNRRKATPFFMHVNYPKIDPAQIFQSISFGIQGPTKDSDGKMRRIWHKDADEAIEFFGFDLERKMWHIVKELACKYEGSIVQWYDKRHVCQKAEKYWNAVFGE